jgi:chromosome segregation ATPase
MKSFALALLAQGGMATTDSTISKVITLLDELKTKIQADLKHEGELMEEYEAWCDTQKTETSYAIKDETRVISEQSAHVEGSSGQMEESSSQIDGLVPSIGGKEEEKKKAETLRAEQNKDFLAKEQELVEAEDMLRRAHGILKRHMTSGLSFAQGGAQKMEEVVKALGAIVSAAGSMSSAKHIAQIKSFMETTDELKMNLKEAPQAQTSAYESKSGAILQTIDEMRDETMDNLREARRLETNQRQAYELLVQSLTNQIATFNKELEGAKAQLASATASNGAAKRALASESDRKAADEEYLASVNQDCADKAQGWANRQQSATEELAAVDKAKEVLSAKVVVLVQTSSSVKRDADEKRDRVVSLLRGLGRRFNSFGLLQAASSAAADPFEKVRGLIRQMISKLEKQAADEASHKERCDKELAENTQKQQNKVAALNKYNTRFDSATARQTKVKKEVATLQQEIKELDAAVAEATKLRNEENAENTKTIADNKDSAAAVSEAIAILRKFYAAKVEAVGTTTFSLAQKSAAPSFDFNAGKTDAAHTILAILETAQSDFSKLAMETEESEAASLADYKTYMQKSEVTKNKKQASILGKESEIKALGVQIAQVKDDISSTEAELDAVNKTLETLKNECANKAMSYEERKQRREAEIAGLQNALEILSEDNMSFLQKRK